MARKHLPKWIGAGYRVIVLQDRVRFDVHGAEVYHHGEYHGYAWAVNYLYRVVSGVSGAPVVVLIGDDMDPDPHKSPGEIRREFEERFPDTFGVMQPIGDPLSGVDRICGSPWVGRSFASRINGGVGPLWPGYYHFFADEELFDVTTMLGCLWQRRDLSHYHDHWSRRGERPPHLGAAQDNWDADKATHTERKSKGFPGHAPLFISPRNTGSSVADVVREFLKTVEGREPPDSSDSISIEAIWVRRFRNALKAVGGDR